ncbi:MAG: DUF861 domain-containing protein [Proteobacteria bacterium]|nr:DUF861 domain-containing protein [Pseudomonadota bacterium]
MSDTTRTVSMSSSPRRERLLREGVQLLRRAALAALAVGALAPLAVRADSAPKPVKLTAAEAAGPVFKRKDAVHENGADGPTTDVVMLKSKDGKMSAGAYQAGPSDTPIEAYPEDEFCYFLTGSVKLTSADGSVVDVHAGEAVFIHKGWKGRWTTPGYTKYYVVYESK